MWNEPSKERLSRLPSLYATEDIPVRDKIIHLNFFLGMSHWYAVEFDGADTFFGFVIINGDSESSEWGYFSLSELKALKVAVWEVDCELEEFWEPRKASEVAGIKC